MVLPITKMARKHVSWVPFCVQTPGCRDRMASDDQRMLLLLLPGETARAPSCLVPEEVEALKGLERYYANGGNNGVPEPQWVSGRERLRMGTCRAITTTLVSVAKVA